MERDGRGGRQGNRHLTKGAECEGMTIAPLRIGFNDKRLTKIQSSPAE